MMSVCAACVVAMAPSGLHRLHGDRRAVDEAAHDHGHAEGEQHAERIHLEDADVGNDERNQRAKIAEGAGDLHAVEAVGDWRWDGLFGHDALRRCSDHLMENTG